MGIPVKIFLSKKVFVIIQCVTIESVPETGDLYTHSLRSGFKMTIRKEAAEIPAQVGNNYKKSRG